MDKKLTYQILLSMQDRASSTVKIVEKELDKVQEAASKVVTGFGLIGDKISVVSTSSANKVRDIGKSVDLLRGQFQNAGKGAATVSDTLGKGATTAVPKFNMLNMSVQQVARELPALAISANMFFLAISNNLPILADNIQATRKENQALIASGQKAVPVWRQVAGSIFSWQTALVAGVTILSMYGGEIIEFTKDLFTFSEGFEHSRKTIEELKKTTQKYNTELLQEINNLRYSYDAILKTAEGTVARKYAIDALNESYGKYMPYLLTEKSGLEELKTAYNAINSSLRSQIALKVRASQTEDILKESAEKQSAAIVDMQNAFSKQGVDTSMSDKIIASLIDDAPKWKDAGDTLGEAFQQSMKNIEELNPRIAFNSDTRKGIYNYLKSFYQMETAVEAVNKRVDLLLGKTNQITEIGEIIVTPEKKKGNDKEANKDVNTIGGVENKIKSLKDTQSKAMGEQAIALEKEIKLWEKKLELMQSAIIIGAAQKPDMKLLETPEAKLNLKKMKAYNPKTNPDTGKLLAPAGPSEKELKKAAKLAKANLQAAFKNEDIFTPMQEGIFSITDAMRSFSGVVGEAAGAWLQWGSTLLNTIAQAIPAILQMIGVTTVDTEVTRTNANAHLVGATAKAMNANAGLGPFGWIAGIAAVAAIIGTMMSIPKLAGGTVASGPMLAMIGEYPGASNNPEIVAPSGMIRKIVREESGSGIGNGTVVFRIKGDVLEGILHKQSNKRSRTR